MAPTEVAASIPISNTGKVKLELRKSTGLPVSVSIPVKGSVLISSTGTYQVIAHPLAPALPVTIANIVYEILQGFHVTPTSNSVKDARFTVYVNLSEA